MKLTLTSANASTIFGTSNLSEGFKRTNIKSIKSYVVMNQKFNNPNIFIVWQFELYVEL